MNAIERGELEDEVRYINKALRVSGRDDVWVILDYHLGQSTIALDVVGSYDTKYFDYADECKAYIKDQFSIDIDWV